MAMTTWMLQRYERSVILCEVPKRQAGKKGDGYPDLPDELGSLLLDPIQQCPRSMMYMVCVQWFQLHAKSQQEPKLTEY